MKKFKKIAQKIFVCICCLYVWGRLPKKKEVKNLEK